MYLSTHFSASLLVSFFSVEKPETRTCDNYHFLLIQDGTITVSSGEKQYSLSGGDVFLMEPDCSYEMNLFSKNYCLDIELNKGFIEQLLPWGTTLQCNSAVGRKNEYKDLAAVLVDITIAYLKEDNQNEITSLLFRLMEILKHNHIKKSDPETGNVAAERINEIRTYIQQNYHLPLSLQELSEQMYLSPQYLSKFIKQNMGITFVHYLNNVRMEHAYEELMHTDHSVTEIAFNNGFSNTAAFNKSFRDLYGEAPSAHRLRMGSAVSDEHSQALPEAVHDLFGQENPSEKMSFRLQADDLSSYYPSWSDTMNIGALYNALSISFHDIFADIQRQVGFRYVRFDDIFSEEIMRPLGSGKGFDYTNLNMVLDFFKDINILPFVELSFKPHKRNLIDYRQTSYEESFRKEKALSYYFYALDDLLRHCINRYGYDYVSKWRFEVWQKHDERLNYLSAARRYVENFRLYREIIKNLLPSCPVGGPGYNASALKAPFLEILNEMNRTRIYPDFFSIYIYCHEPEQHNGSAGTYGKNLIMSPDRDFALLSFRKYQDIIRETVPDDIPLYVTECNSGLSGSNYVSAAAFQSAFICKTSLDLFRETSCIAYWHFSDAVRQFDASPQLYSTDTGLVDINEIPKPSLFAYIMLGKLGKQLIGKGENFILTSGGRTQYQLLAFHYQHYTRYFCLNCLSHLSMEHTYEAFEEASPIEMQFDLENLPVGRYKILRHILSRDYGSILDEFIRIFKKGNLTPDEMNDMMMHMDSSEIEYYKHHIRPRQEISFTETDSSGNLRLAFSLEPHEVILFELTKKI